MPKTLPMTGERYIPGMLGDIVLEHMHRYVLTLDLVKNKNVLDIASGEGYGSYLLASVATHVTGVDINSDAIEYARQKYQLPNIDFCVGSCESIPLADKSVEIVVSFETIEHHDKHQEMIREIYRVLKDDGLLIISSPNKKFYSDIPSFNNEFHIKELYFDEFHDLLRQYFPNVELYGQRVLKSSVITPLSSKSRLFKHFQSQENQNSISDEIRDPIYFIILAGKNSTPPKLDISIYENKNDYIFHEAKMYWKSDKRSYTEQYSTSINYPANNQHQQIELVFPSESDSITNIRLDISNTLAIIDIETIQLLSPTMEILWTWNGNPNDFQDKEQTFISDNPDNNVITVISLGDDPKFELKIPIETCLQIKEGYILFLQLKAYNYSSMIEKLANILEPTIFFQKTKHIKYIQTDISLNIQKSLNDIIELIGELQKTKKTALNQNKNYLDKINTEITRSEAQLTLLKKLLTSSLN